MSNRPSTLTVLLAALLLSATTAIVAAQEPAANASVSKVTVKLPRQGSTIQVSKILDQATGEESTVATDASGRPVDYFAALRTERGLGVLPANKIHPTLRAQLAAAGHETVPVSLWLRFDEKNVDFRAQLDLEASVGAKVEEAISRARARVAEGNLLAVEPALQALRAMGFPIVFAAKYAPIITVRANATQVSALAELPFVDTLYASITFEDSTDDAIATHRWNRVHDFGIRGDGIKVAVLEDNGIDDAACVGNILNVIGYNNANHNIQDHPTGGASVIGSLNTAHPGHARGIQLLSANGTNGAGNPSYVDTDIIAASDWAIGQGANVVNCSFGFNNTPLVLQMIDRYVDYSVRFTTTTFAVSAGNNGNGNGNVSSPAVSYNCIAVGAIDDQNTRQWTDDVMASYSSFVDPTSTHGDREKPELAAEGTDMTMLDLGCAFTYVASGTSFAAPGVAGMCGALMQMSSTLQSWPEAMKAIMMAAAAHNVEGASRLSDVDGAGGMNGLQAYRIIEGNRFTTGSLTPASFTATGYATRNIYLQGGDKTRVVLVWDSNANASYSTDVLEADLDIVIFAGQNTISGTSYGSSLSFDNPYEIVEFCPPATGWYTVRINDYRFDGTSEYFGLAWTQDVDGRYIHYRQWLPVVTASDAVGPTTGNPYFWVDPIDFASGGQPFLGLASLSSLTGFDFPAACRHSYGDLDQLTLISFDPNNPYFLNFQGTYGASGTTYSTRINVPDIPGIGGFPIDLSLYTLDAAAPDGCREFSKVESIKLWDHATDLVLGDDGFSGPIPLGFSFPFFGVNYTECYVNANGNVTFNAGDSDYTETLAELTAGNPRIAPLWDDLNTNIGGKIRTRAGGGSQFVVEWAAVPEFATTTANQNSVLVILNSDGTIEFKYHACSLQDAIAGISPGGGSGSTSVDLSHGFKRVSGLFGPPGAIYEQFTGVAPSLFDLDTSSAYRGKVRFTPGGINAYVVTYEGP